MPVDTGKIFKDLFYRDTNSSVAIAQTFQKISELGGYYEAQKNKFTSLASKCGATLFTSLFVGIMLFVTGVATGFVWVAITILVLFILLVIVTIYSYIQSVKYSKLTIDRVRRELPGKILAMLDRDLNSEKPITIEADFKSPTENSKQISKGPHPYRQRWEMKEYRDPWLNITGEFLDGSDFQLSIIDFYRISSGWKTSSSGKSKHKSKTKFKCAEILVSLKYPQRKYGAIQLLKQDILDAIQLPYKASVKRLKVEDERIILCTKSSSNIANDLYETTVAMLLSLYQPLNLARMLSKKKC